MKQNCWLAGLGILSGAAALIAFIFLGYIPAESGAAENQQPVTSVALPPSVSNNASCLTTGNTDAISLAAIPARTAGVAPLAVFFDATGTTASASTRPFHELEYRWDFGDSLGSPLSGTTWGTGSNPGVSSRNTAAGPVSAHVFERPGTYTVTLNITDGTNTVSNNCTRIVVQDPEVIFSGNKTVCVGAASIPVAGVGGCPAGAAVAMQPNFASAISAYAKTGQRVLFRRGDVFTTQVKAEVLQAGPGVIGSFGAGAIPVVRTTATSDATLSFSGRTTPAFSDWRVMDIEFDGGGGRAIHGVAAFGGITQITLLRLTMRSFETAIGLDSTMANYWNNKWKARPSPGANGHVTDQIAIVDSTVIYGPNTHYGAYSGGNRYAFMGNFIDNGGLNILRGDPINGSHVTRFPYLGKAVIANNSLERPGFDRHGIKLHGPTWGGSFAGTGGAPLAEVEASWSNYSTAVSGDGYSKQIVISGNKLSDFINPWSVVIGPQNASSDERVRDVILERNLHLGSPRSQAAFVIRAREVTIRNNLFIGNAGGSYQAGIRIEVDGAEPPARNVWIYNNTQYSAASLSKGQFLMVDIKHVPNVVKAEWGNSSSFPSDITIKNNLAYAPNAVTPLLYRNTGNDPAMNIVVSNNSKIVQIKNGPAPFTVPAAIPLIVPPFTLPPLFAAAFTHVPGSYAVNTGAIVPVWSDFHHNPRPLGVIDLGIAELQ